MEKNKLASSSSLIVSLPAMLLWLVLGIICAALDLGLLAGVFVFLFLLSACARFWAARAMKGVALEISCDVCRLYPGMSSTLRYRLKNDKLLPLIWLELSQNAPERDCLLPDESFERYSYSAGDEEVSEKTEAFRRGFSFVMGYETLELSAQWQAQRRGLYKPEKLLLRSGDGFGLSQVECLSSGEKLPEFVIYPRRVPVDVSLFLRTDWERSIGSAGFAEDMTVLRGLRPYTPADSWKRINWRMAARQQNELKVNFYETVQPAAALFVLDGESFCNLRLDFEQLEDCLEVLGSVISELFSRGVCCGLCLPESQRFGAVNLPPDSERSAEELLYYLSGYDCKAERVKDREDRDTEQFKASCFDNGAVAAAAMNCGIVAIFTAEPESLPQKLMSRLDSSRCFVFSCGSTKSNDPELKVLHISRLKKGGGQ